MSAPTDHHGATCAYTYQVMWREGLYVYVIMYIAYILAYGTRRTGGGAISLVMNPTLVRFDSRLKKVNTFSM